jgi:hypothetical protein
MMEPMREGQRVRFRLGSVRVKREQRGRVLQILPPGVGDRKEPLCVVEHAGNRKRYVVYMSELVLDAEGDADPVLS